MAVFDASGSSVAFAMGNAGLEARNSTFGMGPTIFDFTTISGLLPIFTDGTGNTFILQPGVGDFPITGTTTAIGFGLTVVSGMADAPINGLSVPTANLVNFANAENSENQFWATVLGGNDTIIAPTSQLAILAGDFRNITQTLFDAFSAGSGFLAGGDETITDGATVEFQELAGDA